MFNKSPSLPPDLLLTSQFCQFLLLFLLKVTPLVHTSKNAAFQESFLPLSYLSMGHLSALLRSTLTPNSLFTTLALICYAIVVKYLIDLFRGPKRVNQIAPDNTPDSAQSSIDEQLPDDGLTPPSTQHTESVSNLHDRSDPPVQQSPPRPKYVLTRFSFPITHTADTDVKPLSIHLPQLESDRIHSSSILAPQQYSTTALSSFSSTVLNHNKVTPGKLQVLLIANGILLSSSSTTSSSSPLRQASPILDTLPFIQWLCANNCEIYLILLCQSKQSEHHLLQQLKQSGHISSHTILASHVLVCQQEETILSYARQLLPSIFISPDFRHTQSTYGLIPFVALIKPNPDDKTHQQHQYQTMLANRPVEKDITSKRLPLYLFVDDLNQLKHL